MGLIWHLLRVDVLDDVSRSLPHGLAGLQRWVCVATNGIHNALLPVVSVEAVESPLAHDLAGVIQ
jgi:hypothetical protein